MKKGKNLIIFTSGIILGAIGSYLYLKKQFNFKVNQVLDELNELNEKKNSRQEVKKYKKSEKISENIKNNETKSKKITDYTSFYKEKGNLDLEKTYENKDPGGPLEYDPDDPEEIDEDDGTNEFKKVYNKGIEIIHGDEYEELFTEEGARYDKEELIYYILSETLVNDEDEIVDGYLDLIGSEWRDILEQGVSGSVYVRNNKFGTDYCIIGKNLSFGGDI